MQIAFRFVAMTGNLSPTSQTDLSQRRQQLRRQRRMRFFRGIWRLSTVAGLAGGLIWLSSHPGWLIREPSQVKVEGNQFLPTQAVRSLLPITYPESLLQVQPQAIAEQLKAKAPIADVIVTRQLFPPGLTVRIRERVPVAITLLSSADAQWLSQPAAKGQAVSNRVGLLDESGVSLPLQTYLLMERSVKLPALRVFGDPDAYRPYWQQIYQQIIRSPVKISEIDFQNPANLVLKTELGQVHLGAYGLQFPNQLRTLDRMRQLPAKVNLSQVAYIDLRNPASPMLQMVSSKESTRADIP